MYRNQIDSVFEVVTYGKVSSLNKGDTLNFYYLDDTNHIKQKLSSFMCCSYDCKFDSLGLLNHKRIFSDYPESYSYKRVRKNNTIYETMESNLGTIISYDFKVKNELIISKLSKQTNNDNGKLNLTEKTAYEYNNDNRLAKKTKIIINKPSGEYADQKNVMSYVWDKGILKQINIEQSFLEDEKDVYFSEHILFDSIGFPIKKTVIKEKDTLYKTIIKRR